MDGAAACLQVRQLSWHLSAPMAGIVLDLDLAIIVRFPNVRSVVRAQELAHASDKIIEKALN